MMRKNRALRSLFMKDPVGTVIVLPSPHGDHKRGISYSDACAAAEIYSCFSKVKDLDVRTPESLDLDISRNLVLLGGPRANSLVRDSQFSRRPNLTFELEDGVIHDKEKSVVLTPRYMTGGVGTEHVRVDYGLLVYSKNPFGQSTQTLLVAGIRGIGTLAAAVAVSDEKYGRKIDKLLRQSCGDDPAQLTDKTIEILVKVAANNGRILRNSLTIEKVVVSDGSTFFDKWESREYSQLKSVSPHKLHIDVIERSNPSFPFLRIRINEQELPFQKSPDRLRLLYALAEQAKTDYLNQSPNGGWISAYELAEKVWQISVRNGTLEIPAEIRREVSSVIATWAKDMQRQGKLRLDANSRLDRDYINSEILVFDSQIKKKIADLVYLINQDEKNRVEEEFHIIESRSGLGYRLNIHPALVFCAHTKKSA